jgi:cytidylate kinase
MIIAISGKSGCGNTTASHKVAEALGLKPINYTFRSMAAERGLSFEEVRERAELDPTWDQYLDRKQVELASAGNCVLGSRLAIWLLGTADLKVFLDAPCEVRAGRIHMREKGDFATVLARMIERDRRDHERYLRLYGIDNDDFAFADLVIDTSCCDAEGVTERIVQTAGRRA